MNTGNEKKKCRVKERRKERTNEKQRKRSFFVLQKSQEKEEQKEGQRKRKEQKKNEKKISYQTKKEKAQKKRGTRKKNQKRNTERKKTQKKKNLFSFFFFHFFSFFFCRMTLSSLLNYISQLEFSSSRNKTTVYFDIFHENQNQESSQEEKKNYKILFQELRKKDRAGVIKIEKEKIIGVHWNFFKELYIFPLSASDPVPSFINSDEYDRDLEDMLIGVFITDKVKEVMNSFTLPQQENSLSQQDVISIQEDEPYGKNFKKKKEKRRQKN